MIHPELARIRADFPALRPPAGARVPVYLDSACTTLRPEPVIEAMAAYMRSTSGCHGRANHAFGREATRAMTAAREATRALIGAAHPDEVIFVRSCTEAINLVAECLPLRAGDAVLTTGIEHNSNLLPWQGLARRRGVRHLVLPLEPAKGLDLVALRAQLQAGVRLVSVVHVSNLCGIELPIADICREAHRVGAWVLVDGAQSVATHPINVQAIDADFFAFSLHKVFGPEGMGVLYGKRDLLARMPAWQVGGDTVEDTTYDSCTWSGVPERFEAGVANTTGAVGAAAAIGWLRTIGPERILAHATALNRQATEALSRFARVQIIGPKDAGLRGPILNFHVQGLDSRSLAGLLDERAGVMVRYGKHCVHAWYNASGTPDSVRASFSIYNTPDDIEALTDTVANVLSMIG